MKNKITSIIISMLIITITSFTAYASEIDGALQTVKNITHPITNRYSAGQPTPDEFAAFAQAGVKHVINFRPPDETPEINEAAIITKNGMAYYNVPISGIQEMTIENIKLVDKLLKQIGNEPVLLHCSSGNRVGAVMALSAAWLKGASHEEAIAIGKRWGLTKLQPRVERLLNK
ncbi:MAG: protein tyrosine phosphatase family protein [Gammaproteobacteria bacterium]|nr:protein tyrosine phosphatase family protein [Gammaproteobacteria bacterium]